MSAGKITKETYLEVIGELDAKINELSKQKIELREDFIKDNAQFEVGDKVVIIWDAYKHPFSDNIMPEKRETGIVHSMNDRSFQGRVIYQINKIKKDGSMSQHPIHHYGASRIELVEKKK